MFAYKLLSQELGILSGGSTSKLGWSQNHLDLQKNVYIFATKKKKKIYTKLTYCDHPNKNREYLDLKITKI